MTNIAGETSIGTILREFQVFRLTYECKLFIYASTIILGLTGPINNMWTLLNFTAVLKSFWQTLTVENRKVISWGYDWEIFDPLCFYWYILIYCGCRCNYHNDWWQQRRQTLVRFWTLGFACYECSKDWIQIREEKDLRLHLKKKKSLLRVQTCRKGNRS